MTISTINPNNPVTDSPLDSAPVRDNFLAAYNDINSILAILAGLGTLSNQNYNSVSITGGSIAGTTLNAGTVPYSALTTIPNNSVIGNISGVTASPSSISQSQLTSLISVFTSGASGAVPASGGGTTAYLRADGTFAVPAGTSGTVSNVSASGLNGVIVSVTNPTTTPSISISLGAITPNSITTAGNISGATITGTSIVGPVTGNASTSSKWLNARLLAGNSVDGSADVPFANKFIVQGTTDAGLSGAQFLGALSTGLVKNTTTTGILSIAVSGTDYQGPITLTTSGTSGAATFISGTLNIPQYAGATYTAGTGLTLTGTAFSVNTSQNITTLSNLTANGIVTTSGGIGTLSVTATTGSGSVVLANSPTLITPALGTPSALVGTNITGTAASLSIGGNAATATSAAKWTTARLLAGNSVDGSTNVAFANKFIVQGTTDTGLTGAQFLGALTTGLVKNTTTTGVLSIAVANTDYQSPISLTTTGSGAATFVGNVLNIPTPTAGTGSVTSVSVVSANGFAGTVATATTTPAITISTSITGIIKGNGTAISAATAGTDYQAPISLTTTGTTGAATFISGTLNIPNYANTTYSAGTGLTLTSTTFSVNTSQNIATLSNLTSNGSVMTTGGAGTLTVVANTGMGNNVLATAPSISGATITTSTVNGVTLTATGSASSFLNASGTYTSVSAVPAGSNGQVQYNNSGVFGASANLTFDGSILTAVGLFANGSSNIDAFIGTDTTLSMYPGIWFGAAATTRGVTEYSFLFDGGTTGTLVNTPSGGYVQFRIDNDYTNGLLLDANKNVGVGFAYTATPAAKLDVAGTFHTSGVNTLDNLAGTGTRMVTATSTGVLGTAAIPGGSPAGSTGYIQYNSSGAFAANSNLFYDITDSRLGVNNSSPTYAFDVAGGSSGNTFRAASNGSINQIVFENTTGAGNFKNQFSLRGNSLERYSIGNDISNAGLQNLYFYDSTNVGTVFYADASGNCIIGLKSYSGSPFTAGFTADVQGTLGASGAVTFTNLAGTGPRMVTASSAGLLSTAAIPTGTVTSVSVASANGFAGSSSGGAIPALTISTSITGIIKGNGTAISAATAGTDYVIPSGSITGTSANVTGIVLGSNGGTGTANTGKTITIGGNFSTVGAFTTAITATANTAVTLPTSGTLYGTATGSITSAQLAASLTDETGTGANVFGTAPTINQPNIVGVTTNSAAAAGSVGEVIESSIAVGSGPALTSGTAKTITSISLTAGDWDVWGNVGFVPAGTTSSTLYAAGISETANTQPTAPGGGAFSQVTFTAFISGGSGYLLQAGKTHISLATTTTIFLVGTAAFSISTMGSYGYIGARRIR